MKKSKDFSSHDKCIISLHLSDNIRCYLQMQLLTYQTGEWNYDWSCHLTFLHLKLAKLHSEPGYFHRASENKVPLFDPKHLHDMDDDLNAVSDHDSYFDKKEDDDVSYVED